ncbi:hypothetical protein PSE10B_43860 [Pseudomonas amygdali pv. eriobotryae]|uniref:Uncharacterized protein n=1 Tax=Pseudomonas syringae pv. daphniphylli TaxID=264455 RepID=A0A9X0H3C4_PSESX|nr:Unknown protein sequence [Pseudomonas syringae pv. daphniphylli]KPX91899.1 hypothetical protein ALO62_03133 [Pseudomonas amygdali pv. myricae]GFZ67864.1 hypothetical protein PSE10B_43860 [Pseudomonas amygdali pv. eriobotryae]RMT50555.1 hypothetical protein ALP46_200185 [Pseudomonas amygdali pv. myricae]RMV07593.1 hypothetical protein ALP18_200371 [Pseudomonas amygdali pv. myricae]
MSDGHLWHRRAQQNDRHLREMSQLALVFLPHEQQAEFLTTYNREAKGPHHQILASGFVAITVLPK